MFPKHARYQTAPYPEDHNRFLQCVVVLVVKNGEPLSQFRLPDLR